jgi:hypothetical protein
MHRRKCSVSDLEIGVPRLQSVDDAEVWALLSLVLAGSEHDAEELDRLRDDRLHAVLQAMNTLRAELVAAMAALRPEA